MKKKKIVIDPAYGYHRLEPIPSQEEVNKFYSEEFYSLYSNYFNDSSLTVQQEEKQFFNSRWDDIFINCCDYFGPDAIRDKKLFNVFKTATHKADEDEIPLPIGIFDDIKIFKWVLGICLFSS